MPRFAGSVLLLVSSLTLGLPAQHAGARARDTDRGTLAAVRDTMVIARRGQSLSQVVMRHFSHSDYASAHEMLDWTRYHNRLTSDVLITGQSLRIPLGPLDADHFIEPIRDAGSSTASVRGLYINVRRSGQRGAIALAKRLLEVGGNAVVFDIKDRDGRLTYNSGLDFAKAVGAADDWVIDDPSALIHQLHELGVHVIARLVCFQDGCLASSRPDLAVRTADGQVQTQHDSHGWVDPALPAVQNYLFDLMAEAAAIGVDEIQLDYVRFPTAGDHGVLTLSTQAGPSRADVITDFVLQASAVAKAHGVQMSADVFGIAAWARTADSQRTGQDVQRLLPYLDVVSPMLYPSHFSAGFGQIKDLSRRPFELVYQGCVRLGDAAAGHNVRVRPWIQAFPWKVANYSALYVADQLRATVEGGASGWLLWNPANQYRAALEAMRYFPGPPPHKDSQDSAGLEAEVDTVPPASRDAAAEPLGALISPPPDRAGILE